MSYLDRKDLLSADLMTRSITKEGSIKYYNTDKNVANIYMKLMAESPDGAQKEVSVDEASNYTVTIDAIKSKTNQIRTVPGVLSNDLTDETCAIWKFELGEDLTNQIGEVICQTYVKNTTQNLTMRYFAYTVEADKLTGLNSEIVTDPDLPILKELIKEVQETAQTVNNIDNINVSDTKTYSNKKIEEKFSGVDAQFNTIEQRKISKGNVSASDINKNLGKFDSSYLTDDLISAIAGTASIYPTLQSRGVVSGEIGINTITPELTNFFKASKNLFNKNNRYISKTLNASDGTLLDDSTLDVSNYIPVIPNVTYTRNSAHIACFYNKDFQFISAIGTGRQIVTPSNTAYVRLVVPKILIDSYQFEVGNVETSYQDYENIFDIELVKDGSISSNKTTFFEVGKNIFNKDLGVTGYYVDYTSGILITNASYTASDYIEVLSNENYSYNFYGQLAFYDKDKKYISGINGGGTVGNKTLITPSNCKYIRFSTKLPDEFQVEKGTVNTIYEPYGLYIKKTVLPAVDLSSVAKKDDFLLFLPSEICIAKGRTIELYNNQITWCGNINNYHFKWDCQVGKAFKRKYSIVGNTLGNYPLTVYVYDNNMNLVTSANTTIKIIDNVKINISNILTIGDSLSNTTSTYKPTYAEIRTLSNNKLNFVGTRGLVEGEKHEGRSGWASSTFLSNASYSFENEGVNPFWDGTRFNWSHYKNTTGIDPNAIDIWLGTNGIALDPNTNANNIKQIVDYIRQDDVNIPIFITFTLYRANQDGIGSQTSNDGYDANKLAWKLEEDRKVFNLMVKLNELLKNYTNLYFIPVSLCHDSEFNFGNREISVNPRAIQKEFMPIEATHPQEQGYLQIADIKFSSYFAHLS